MEQNDEKLFTAQDKQFEQHIRAILKRSHLKLDKLIEEQKLFAAKLDRVAAKVERIDGKLDGLELRLVDLADDFAAHRADTEVHGHIYSVKERVD